MKIRFQFVLVLCLCIISCVWADEIPVSSGTNTISAALVAAYPGDVFVLESGTYIETNTITTPGFKVIIRGVLKQTIFEINHSAGLFAIDGASVAILVGGDIRLENIIFNTDRVGRGVVNWAGSVNVGEEYNVKKNSVFIDHCEFRNFTATPVWIPDPGVTPDKKAHPVDTLSVTNSLFYNGDYQSIRGEYQQTHVAIIKNCTFWNNYRENLKVYGHETISDYMHYLVDHCTFYGAKQIDGKTHGSNHGVYFKYTSGDDTVRNCIMSKLAGVGINGNYFTEMNVQYCVAFDCGGGPFNQNVSNIGQLILQEDPLFNDPDNGDFSLKEGSLAIGWTTDGTNCGNPITDWTHVLTPVGYNSVTDVPAAFSLSQNYPNPFNPSTAISYSLKKTGLVTIEIYSITGHKVRTLIDEFQSPGSHSVVWDGYDDAGNSVAGGVYFYRLKSGSNVQTRKMVFLK